MSSDRNIDALRRKKGNCGDSSLAVAPIRRTLPRLLMAVLMVYCFRLLPTAPKIKNIPKASVPRPCVQTVLRKDRPGAQIHDMFFAWAYAKVHHLDYVGAVGSPQESYAFNYGSPALVKMLELPWDVVLAGERNRSSCTFLNASEYRKDELLSHTSFAELKATRNNTNSTKSIVVFIRRGDVTPNLVNRYLPNAYYLDQIDVALQKFSNTTAIVTVFTQKQNTEPLDLFAQRGHEVRLDAKMEVVWRAIIDADWVILSHSSFSYVPALLSRGTIVYHRFWHNPHDSWNKVDRDSLIQLAPEAGRISAMMQPSSIHVTGAGGSGGMYFCDGANHVLGGNRVATLQMLLGCWRWFLSARANSCLFAVGGKGAPPWIKDWIRAMGCFSVPALDKKFRDNIIAGQWSAATTQSEWNVTPSDVEVLRTSFLQRHRAISSSEPTVFLGVLENSRKSVSLPWLGDSSAKKDFLNTVIPAEGPTRPISEERMIDFNSTSLLDMASWMHSHQIVIMAHSDAVANAIFMKPCGVAILLYPQDHCQTSTTLVYEPLLQIAGVVPISWRPACEQNQSIAAVEQVHISLENLIGLVNNAFQARTKCMASPQRSRLATTFNQTGVYTGTQEISGV